MSDLRARRSTTVLGAVLLAGMAAAAPAAAAPAGPEHCTLNAATGEQVCFADFTGAIAHASQGRVADAPAGLAAATGDLDLQRKLAVDARTASGDIIQATLFDDRDYGGDSLTVWGEALCKKDGYMDWQLDLEDGWKDRISSVQGWGNCSVWLYPEPGLNGDRDGPFDGKHAWVGDMLDDRAQSVGLS